MYGKLYPMYLFLFRLHLQHLHTTLSTWKTWKKLHPWYIINITFRFSKFLVFQVFFLRPVFFFFLFLFLIVFKTCFSWVKYYSIRHWAYFFLCMTVTKIKNKDGERAVLACRIIKYKTVKQWLFIYPYV